MKIAVVGGAGFIGSHLVDLLVENHKVFVIDNLFLGKKENVNIAAEFFVRDASDIIDLRLIFKKIKPDVVFNLAVLPLPHSIQCPYKNVMENTLIVSNLLDLQHACWFDRLIHFSSSEVYGSAQYTPMCESHPLEAVTPYAASKAAGDLICMSYHRTFHSKVSIIRPFNNYGPRQNMGTYAGLIPITVNRIMNGKAPLISGDGLQTRDYIYVGDTARAAKMLLERKDLDGEIINVASGRAVSVYEIVRDIRDLMKDIS